MKMRYLDARLDDRAQRGLGFRAVPKFSVALSSRNRFLSVLGLAHFHLSRAAALLPQNIIYVYVCQVPLS